MRPLVITFVIKRGQDRGLPQDYVHKGYFLLEDRRDFRPHVRAIPGAKWLLGEKQWRLPATVAMIRKLRPHLDSGAIRHANETTLSMLFQLRVECRIKSLRRERTMTTVRAAANLLAARCDGAVSVDGAGFNKFDSPFIKELLAKQRWTQGMERAVHKTLRKYKAQLASAGIDYDQLQFEVTEESASVKANFGKQAMELSADDRGRLLLKSRFDFKDQVKAIPFHRWLPDEKLWRYLPKIEVYRGLQPYLSAGEIVPDAAAKAILADLAKQLAGEQERIANHGRAVAEATKIKEARDIEIDVPLKTKPFTHQKKAYAVGITLDSAAFLMEQGTGKTLAAIAVAGHRYQQGQVKRVLIGCPLSVVPVWRAEFEKHAAFPHLVGTFSASHFRQGNPLDTYFTGASGLHVTVINYESIWRIEEYLAKWKPDLIILDEGQKIKNGRAKQSKACHRLGKVAKYRLELTGTPVTQSPLDVWSQYLFLNPDIFGKSFRKFRDQYAIMGGYGGYEVVGYKNLEDLANRAHSIAYRVTKADALDLPPTTDQVLYCDLEESAKTYKKMEQEMVATVGADKVSAPIVLTQLLRLQQITGGFLPVGDTGETTRIENVGCEKLKLLRDFLEDFPTEKKVVIFARFLPEVKAISKLLKELAIGHHRLTGETPGLDRGRIVKEFQEEQSIRAIVIQIQAGGLGITLTAADTEIFYSTSFSFADYEQARARVHRIGQKRPVTYIHLIARGTIDETVLEALKEKKDIAELVIDSLNPTYRKGVKMAKTKKHFKTQAPVLELPRPEDDDQVKRTVDELERKLSPKTQAGDSQMSKKEQHDNDDEVKTPKKSKKVKDKAEKKVKAKPADNKDDANMVSLSDIAAKAKVKPAELRKALRKSKITKPGGSWRWPVGHGDIKKVQELAKNLK